VTRSPQAGGNGDPYHARVNASLLEQAARRDEAAVLAVARQVTQLLDRFGAFSVRRDWSETTREIVVEIGESWQQGNVRSQPEQHVETVVKNRFWGEIIELMTRNDSKAAALFYPTVRRLLASWDRGRVQEGNWDDIVQDTARQLWERWQAGDVKRPWALLCTIARRRFLDRVRAQRPEDEAPKESSLGEASGASDRSERFTEQALESLEKREREIVVLMDIEGHTRVEIARKLGLSEGEVLSTRRAGLRRLWRWLGRDLPPPLREVWEEMFKGAKRATPAQIGEKLSLPEGEVAQRMLEAREILGLSGAAG